MNTYVTRFAAAAAATLMLVVLVPGCGGDSDREHVAAAKASLEKKDHKAAIIQLKSALQENPQSGEARFLLGSLLLKDGDAVAAEVELRKALVAKYSADDVVPDLARAMLMQGQAKKVVDEFGNSRFDKPAAQASLQTTLARGYASLGKLDQSQAAWGAALVADGKYAPALLLSARHKATSRDADGALAVVEEVLGRERANVEAWSLKGDILLYAQGKPDAALAAYRKALEVDPKFLPSHSAILTVLMRQGNLDAASKQIEQLKQVAGDLPSTAFLQAQLAYQKRDFKSARELSQQLLKRSPNNPRVLQLAGAAELELGAVSQAESYLLKAIQTSPDLISARRLLLMTYLRSGKSAKALAVLEASAGKEGVSPVLYSVAGEIYLQNGNAKRAEEYFTKALKLDPENANRRIALAISHLAGGQVADGLGELTDIAATDKGVTADLALISVYQRRNELDKALAAIDKLEAKQPEKPTAANLRGRVYLSKRDSAAARNSFERALAIDPNFFAAAASLATLDLADKKPESAKKRFEAMLVKDPKNGQALLALAELAAAGGAGKDEMVLLLTKAVDANPTDVAPRQMLIDQYLRSKDNKQALATAQNAVSAIPTSIDLLYALGRAQQFSGELNQAAATFNKLIALQPLSPVPYMRLAEVQIASKDGRAARQSLHKALEVSPNGLDAQRALIQMELAEKKYPAARKVALTVQEQRPTSSDGFVFEGDIANLQKDWSGAASAYRAALKRGASPAVATKLHAVLVAAGKNAEADAFAATWAKENPKDPGMHLYLGELALGRKSYSEAEKHYAAALQITPNNAVLLNNLAWVTGQSGKDGAVAFAEKANKLAPNQPAFMDTLATLLADKQEFAKAIEVQKKAVDIQPTNAGLRLNLAKIYIKSGKKALAKVELETLAALGSKLSFQGEVAALLKSL